MVTQKKSHKMCSGADYRSWHVLYKDNFYILSDHRKLIRVNISNCVDIIMILYFSRIVGSEANGVLTVDTRRLVY